MGAEEQEGILRRKKQQRGEDCLCQTSAAGTGTRETYLQLHSLQETKQRNQGPKKDRQEYKVTSPHK
jgi:hypothetical protein